MIGLIQKCLRDVAWQSDMSWLLASRWSQAFQARLWLADEGYSMLLCLLASAEADIDRHDGNEKRGEKMMGWRMTRDRWWQVSWHVTGSDQCHADTDILLASQIIDVERIIQKAALIETTKWSNRAFYDELDHKVSFVTQFHKHSTHSFIIGILLSLV